MILLGLTGGMGMGKSTAAQLLRQRGVSVVDTDLLARQIVEPGQAALRELQQAFGNGIISEGGHLRRDTLAGMVFSDAAAREKLEHITHPRIRQLWKQQVDVWRAEQRPLGVVVIPLLFETGADAELDATICVGCSGATQRLRLRERGWTPDQIEPRLAAQWPIEKKMAQADFVVWTEGGLTVLADQLDRILRRVSDESEE